MSGTGYIALVVLSVCLLGVTFAVVRTRMVLKRNRLRAQTRQAAFADGITSLRTEIQQRKAAGLPYDDLVAGFLGKAPAAPVTGTTPPLPSVTAFVPGVEPTPSTVPSAALPAASASADMSAFFAHTRAVNPLVQPDGVRLGVPESPVEPAPSDLVAPAAPGPAVSGASNESPTASSWLDLLVQQTLDGLGRASLEVEAIASSTRSDADKAALVHTALTNALGSLPLAHLTMVRDAGTGPATPPSA